MCDDTRYASLLDLLNAEDDREKECRLSNTVFIPKSGYWTSRHEEREEREEVAQES